MKRTISSKTSTAWQYGTSVAKVKWIYKKHRNWSKQLINELVQAKLQLQPHPGNPWGKYTWKDYCFDAFGGYPCQKTIDSWINNFLVGTPAGYQKTPKLIPGKPVAKKTSTKKFSRTLSCKVKVVSVKTGSPILRITLPEYPTKVFEQPIILQKNFELIVA